MAGLSRPAGRGRARLHAGVRVSPDKQAAGRSRPGTEVAASFGDDPFEIPAILHFLPGQSLLRPPAQVPDRPEVMVSFDAASIDRLGLLADRAEASGELIVLDHHASNAGFGSVSLVDGGAAATAVLAAELIRRLGIPLSKDIALGLYAGLVTDTGSFKYSATTPQVHELAARLLATGIDPGIVARELYDRAPFGYLRMLSAALGRAELDRGAGRRPRPGLDDRHPSRPRHGPGCGWRPPNP